MKSKSIGTLGSPYSLFQAAPAKTQVVVEIPIDQGPTVGEVAKLMK
jgi:hypothetical protein